VNDGCLTWLTLPAELASLAPFTEFVRAGSRLAAIAESDAAKLDLIIEELVVNVARYAYPDGQSGMTAVGYAVDGPGTIFVRVSDEGAEYNPLERDPPDFTRGLADREIGGLGIYLIKELVGSLEYARDGGRNVLSFLFPATTQAPR
jgi:anti-sigma regulatory factor (Ser/Thr protein kinase)